MIVCQKCVGSQIVKNSFSHYEKQNFKCKACGRQFVENGQQNQISAETKQLIDKLLRDKDTAGRDGKDIRDFRDLASELRQ